jgi:hypothetical protein
MVATENRMRFSLAAGPFDANLRASLRRFEEQIPC